MQAEEGSERVGQRKAEPRWWDQVSVCQQFGSVTPTHTSSQASVSPGRASLWRRGLAQSVDSLGTLPLPAADSRWEAGPGELSAPASPGEATI